MPPSPPERAPYPPCRENTACRARILWPVVIAVPREAGAGEKRVALTNDGVKALVAEGYEVLVRHEAGYGAAVGNTAYEQAGAQVVPDGQPLEERADLTLCVEFDPSIVPRLREG